MRRREFIAVLGGAAAWPLTARAQQGPQKMLRVGHVFTHKFTTGWSHSLFAAFTKRMTELGYVEGQSIAHDFVSVPTYTFSDYERGYRELVARGADILLAVGSELTVKAALAAAQGRPVVMVAVDFDPLARGYIKSLARPGGNLTGPYFQQIALTAKRLQLMIEAFPGMRAATVFWDHVSADQWRAVNAAAKKLGLRLAGIEFKKSPYDFEKGLARAPADHRGALIVLASPIFNRQGRSALPKFALKHRMKSMFFIRSYVPAGGLMSYGPYITDLTRRAAEYADRIAKGAKPGDLPVERPRKIELAINLKTAKALGISFPQSILLRATEVIE